MSSDSALDREAYVVAGLMLLVLLALVVAGGHRAWTVRQEALEKARAAEPACGASVTDETGKVWEPAYVVKHLDEAGQRVTGLVCVYRPVRYGDATRRQRKDA